MFNKKKKSDPLTLDEAIRIIKKKMPGIITSTIKYEDKYLFIIVNPNDPLEGMMDNCYSINIETKKFSPFSPLVSGYFGEIMDMFENNNLYSEE